MAGNVKDWENNALANDKGSVPDFMPEGKTPIASVNDWSRESQAAVRLFYEEPGWRNMGHTVNYTSDTTFQVTGGTGAGDITLYKVGQRVRMAMTPPTYFYATISAIDDVSSPPVVTTAEDTVPVGITEVSLGIDPTGQPVGSGSVSEGNVAKLNSSNQYTDGSKRLKWPVTSGALLFDASDLDDNDSYRKRLEWNQGGSSFAIRHNHYVDSNGDEVHTNNTDPATIYDARGDGASTGRVEIKVSDPGSAGDVVVWKFGMRVHQNNGFQIRRNGSWETVSQPIGAGGQRWKGKGSSRQFNTVYTNDTDQAIMISIAVETDDAGAVELFIGESSANIKVAWVSSGNGDRVRHQVSAIVPIGHKYQLSGSGSHTIDRWSELTTG